MMKLHFRGNKFIEIVIYSLAIGIGMVLMLITRHSFWYVLPYILLEIILLYFLLTFRYVTDNNTVKIQYGFLNVKSIDIQNIGSTGFPVKSCLSYHEKTGLQF